MSTKMQLVDKLTNKTGFLSKSTNLNKYHKQYLYVLQCYLRELHVSFSKIKTGVGLS